MTGPKLNEANRVAGSKSGSRASAKYVRSSASKARVVLNLVRDQDVRRADEILQFTDREMARVVRKVLASAVANATNNDNLDPDDLYIKACFADEGPTLKRFRPRAKGRAGKIMKRTCHITVIVDVMSDSALAVREAKTMAKGTVTQSRSARVAASRKAAAPAQAEEAPVVEAPADDTTDSNEEGN
jgi:large subunit ribosomal protein L22